MKQKIILGILLINPPHLFARENNRAFEAGRATGKLVGVFLIILLCIWLIRRTKKKP